MWAEHDGTKDFPVDSSYSVSTRGTGTIPRADGSYSHTLTVSCDNVVTARGPGYTVALTTDMDASRPGFVIGQIDRLKPDTMEWTPVRTDKSSEMDLALTPFDPGKSAAFVARLAKATTAVLIYSNEHKPDTVRVNMTGLAPHVCALFVDCSVIQTPPIPPLKSLGMTAG